MKISYDGDTLSFALVYSKEAVAEIDAFLAAPTTYRSPAGGLTYSSTSDVTDWVLSFMTGNGLKK